MPFLVKRITNDDGDDCLDDRWHLMDLGDNDCDRVLCTGEAYDACSDLVLEHKETKRGGITCSKCLNTVKAYKAIRI